MGRLTRDKGKIAAETGKNPPLHNEYTKFWLKNGHAINLITFIFESYMKFIITRFYRVQ